MNSSDNFTLSREKRTSDSQLESFLSQTTSQNPINIRQYQRLATMKATERRLQRSQLIRLRFQDEAKVKIAEMVKSQNAKFLRNPIAVSGPILDPLPYKRKVVKPRVRWKYIAPSPPKADFSVYSPRVTSSQAVQPSESAEPIKESDLRRIRRADIPFIYKQCGKQSFKVHLVGSVPPTFDPLLSRNTSIEYRKSISPQLESPRTRFRTASIKKKRMRLYSKSVQDHFHPRINKTERNISDLKMFKPRPQILSEVKRVTLKSLSRISTNI